MKSAGAAPRLTSVPLGPDKTLRGYLGRGFSSGIYLLAGAQILQL